MFYFLFDCTCLFLIPPFQLADDELTDYEEAQIKLCEWKIDEFVPNNKFLPLNKEEKDFNEILNKTLPLLSTTTNNFMPIHRGGTMGNLFFNILICTTQMFLC